MDRRAALSRVEVLVVLLMILLLVGLVLAGLARIREDANRQKCANNLKQLGMGVSNWTDTMGQLPPLVDHEAAAPEGRALASIFAHLTPFLEADPWNYRGMRPVEQYHAHSSIAFTFPGKEKEPITMHGGVANTPRLHFLDPSDRTEVRLRYVPMTLPDGSTGYYAAGSYAANGLVPWGTGTLARSFPNGTANTVLLGERPQVCRTADGDEVYNLWGLGFYSPHMPAFATLTPTDPPGLLSTGQIAPIVPLPDGDDVQVRIGRQDAPAGLPDLPSPLQRVRPGRPCDPRVPGGPHTGGFQVVMADGSVRVFGWDTSPRVFWAACWPDGP